MGLANGRAEGEGPRMYHIVVKMLYWSLFIQIQGGACACQGGAYLHFHGTGGSDASSFLLYLRCLV